LYPKPFFEILEKPVNQLVLTVRPDYPGIGGAVNASAPSREPLTANTPAVLASRISKGNK
jgi:hypothetical protein